MSTSGFTSDTDDFAGQAQLPADSARGRWPIPPNPRARRVPLPAAAIGVYAGIRVLGLLIAAFLLRHGDFQPGRSLEQLIIGGDGGFYRYAAAHWYHYNLSQRPQ